MDKLASLYGTLTNSEQKVFTYIYNNRDLVMKMRINDLAKETFTSKTVIINLAQKLGFEGFSDLKYFLRTSKEEENKNDVASDIEVHLKESMDKTFHVTKESIYKAVSKDILEAKTVYVFARGTSKAAGYYLNHLLLTLGIKCVFVKDYNLVTLVSDTLNRDEVVIIISLSGNTEKMLEVANRSKVNGAKIIAITAFGSNEISKISDYSLYFVSDNVETKYNDSISRIGMFLVIEILINTIKKSKI